MSKIAYGSLSTTIGDGTLGYSGGVSFKAQEVCGLYIDIPPVLSQEYSSLIWSYCLDTDNYMLVHVQGRHVEDNAMGRIFPYRGAYEVSREEMNRVGFCVADVINSMPRIKQFPKNEVWEDEVEILKKTSLPNDAMVASLAKLILYAVATQKRIFISIPTAGKGLRENGVFDSDVFNTLVSAIDSLDLEIRRYASFAFCVDQHYAKALDEVLVTVYARESDLQVPSDGMSFKWEEINPNFDTAGKLDDYIKVMKTMPGAKEKLLPLAEMMKKVKEGKDRIDSVRSIKHADFSSSDYSIWLQDGHSANELRADGWAELDKLIALVGGDEAAKKAIVNSHKTKVLNWNISEMNEGHVKLFNMKDELNAAWLEAHLKELSSAPGKWMDMFKNLSLMDKSGVKEAFRKIYAAELKTDIAKCKDAKSYISLVSKYKDLYESQSLVAIIASLDAGSNVQVIDEMLKSRKSGDKAVCEIVKAGLDQIASKKAEALGTDVDKWMKFLSQLKDEDGNGLITSRKHYLLQIMKWSTAKRKEFRKNVATFSKEHPRSAKGKRFELIMNVLHSILEKEKSILTTEPKTPSNSKMQEEKNKTNMVAEGNGFDDKSFEEVYEQVQNEEKKSQKKGRIIWAVLSFLLGIVITAAVAFFMYGGKDEPQAVTNGSVDPQTGDTVKCPIITLTDSTPSIFDLIASSDTTIKVGIDTIASDFDEAMKNATEFPQFDSLYTSWMRKYAVEKKIGEMKIIVK